MGGMGLSFTNPVETWGVWDVCLCLGCGGMGGVGGKLVGAWVLLGGVGVRSVCVVRLDYFCKMQVQVSVLGAPSVHSCCTLSISASYRILVCGRYRKARLVCV